MLQLSEKTGDNVSQIFFRHCQIKMLLPVNKKIISLFGGRGVNTTKNTEAPRLTVVQVSK